MEHLSDVTTNIHVTYPGCGKVAIRRPQGGGGGGGGKGSESGG